MKDAIIKEDAQKIQAYLAQLRIADESQTLNETFAKKEAVGMSSNKNLRKIPAIIVSLN